MPRHDPDFISHLEELRRRLLFCLIIFGILAITAYFFSHQILDFLIEPLRRHQETALYFHKPYEAFATHLKAAGLTAVVLASPVLVTQLWLFIAPGLYAKEKQILFSLIVATALLFLVGILFAYSVVIPWGLHFLLAFQTDALKPLLGVGAYFSFLTGMMIAFGLLFDFPIVLLGLVRLGVIQTEVLKKSRKIAIVLIFIAAAILTPSPDPISQLFLAVPLLGLFEISLFLAVWAEKRFPRT